MQKSKIEYELLNPEDFGEWLANTRRARGMSRRVLAANAGLDVTMICKYEIYGHMPNLANYVRLLSALGLMVVVKEMEDAEES